MGVEVLKMKNSFVYCPYDGMLMDDDGNGIRECAICGYVQKYGDKR